MSLRALHRHCRIPATAAALLSVLLYTVLVASHLVSQVTPRVLIGAQGAGAKAIVAGDPDCHETTPSAGNAKESNHDLPASPPKKCPFCAGYAALHVSVAGHPVSILFDEATAAHFAGLGDGHLIEPASSHSWHSRAPPLLG